MFIERAYTHNEVGDVAQLLQAAAEHCAVMTFQGPIGAGKTTLIRAFLQRLGVTEPIVSPTFTYVSRYRTASGRSVYHFDLYRIERAAQFESMGFLDYLYEPGALIIVEWPEVIASLLTMPICDVTLDYAPTSDKRSLVLKMAGV